MARAKALNSSTPLEAELREPSPGPFAPEPPFPAPAEMAAAASLSIAAVARDTGIGKDTLRVWERRYGFPAPARDAFGERAYPPSQVDKLRVVSRLMDAGFRPARLVPMDMAELQALTGELGRQADAGAGAGQAGTATDELLGLIQRADLAALSSKLEAIQARMAPSEFVVDVVAPLVAAVGRGWMAGEVQVYQEHLCTEILQRLLRKAIGSIPPTQPALGPRVLLTTLPGEPHGLGLLMAEVLLAHEGASCWALGLQTPVGETAAAAAAFNADVVALSCSGCMPENGVISGLADLRRALDDRVELWAGGSAAALQRRALEGVRPVTSLKAIAEAVGRWRGQHDGRKA